MCGIVGVVGNSNAVDILIQGLEKLEYRGYDSAGIYVTDAPDKGCLVNQLVVLQIFVLKLAPMLRDQLVLVTRVGQHMVKQLRIMLTHILRKQGASF